MAVEQCCRFVHMLLLFPAASFHDGNLSVWFSNLSALTANYSMQA